MKTFTILRGFITVLIFSMPWGVVQAETLKEKLSTLEVLPLQYGANTARIAGRELLIVRGKFMNETAWGGDGYTVLVKQDETWQFARHEKSGWKSVLTTTVPHTEEDAIASVSFLVPKGARSALYLLKTRRVFKNSPLDSVPAEFTLYVLQRDEDFGIFYFHLLQSMQSRQVYCNADSAAYHELNIPLPGDGKEYSCAAH